MKRDSGGYFFGVLLIILVILTYDLSFKPDWQAISICYLGMVIAMKKGGDNEMP